VALHPPGAHAGRRTRQIRDPESLAPDAAEVTAAGELFVPSPLSASERSFSADLRAIRFLFHKFSIPQSAFGDGNGAGLLPS